MDEVELGRSGLDDDIGSSAAGAMASCALEGAMLDGRKARQLQGTEQEE